MGVEFILSYTSDKKMIFFENCPYCGSNESVPLQSDDDGTTATGFLTKNQIIIIYVKTAI